MVHIEVPTSRAQSICATIKTMAEKQRRQFLAREAKLLGYGGVSAISRISGVSIPTINRGIQEIENGDLYKKNGRNRKNGGGRKKATAIFKSAVEKTNQQNGTALETNLNKAVGKVLEESTYGDPCCTNRYTNITPEKAAEEINRTYGTDLSTSTVRRVFININYSLQQNKKLEQVGDAHPLRNTQFEYREQIVQQFEKLGLPIISCDTKAKVKLGRFASPGREWRPVKKANALKDHDYANRFRDIYPNGNSLLDDYFYDKYAIVNPYGIYCRNLNTGYIALGISADTSEFSANSICAWWDTMGKDAINGAKELLILVDGGGSNRSKGYLWKENLVQAGIHMGLDSISVFHHPPGTSKWNYIEHRVFSEISKNWKAKPKLDLETTAGYISSTKTKGGLRLQCDIDYNIYLTETQKKNRAKDNNISLETLGSSESSFYQKAHLEHIHEDKTMQQWNYKIVIDQR